jgi:N-methylhydantoinase A
VPLDDPAAGAAPLLPDAAALLERFFAVHERSYGYHNPEDPVEVVNLRLTARGRVKTPSGAAPQARAAGGPAAIAEREVWFDADAPLPTPVHDRDVLRPGHALVGPAVIEQLDATTLVRPGDRVAVDDALNLLIEVAP